MNLRPLHWEDEVLATGLPGKSLSMVLTCISLMFNNVENLHICWLSMFFFGKMSTGIFCLFLNWDCLIFYYWTVWALYGLWKYFLSFSRLLPHFVDSFFCCAAFKVWCSPFYFCCCCFWCQIQKITVKTYSTAYYLSFLSVSQFQVLHVSL